MTAYPFDDLRQPPPKEADADPLAAQVAPIYGDRLGIPRPCRWGCGQNTRQAWEKGRIEIVIDVDGPIPPEQVSHEWPALWWHPRRGWSSRSKNSIADGRLLFVMHPCESRAYRPTVTDAPSTEKEPRMTAPTFGTPGTPGEGVGNDELMGKLLLITVTEKRLGIVTTAGVTDCLATDIVDLESGAVHTDNLLFGKVLFGQLKPGTTYLGRIGKGVAQPGKSAPWLFTGAEEDPAAVATATQYLTYKAANTGAPAPAPATPAFVPPADAATPPWAA